AACSSERICSTSGGQPHASAISSACPSGSPGGGGGGAGGGGAARAGGARGPAVGGGRGGVLQPGAGGGEELDRPLQPLDPLLPLDLAELALATADPDGGAAVACEPELGPGP